MVSAAERSEAVVKDKGEDPLAKADPWLAGTQTEKKRKAEDGKATPGSAAATPGSASSDKAQPQTFEELMASFDDMQSKQKTSLTTELTASITAEVGKLVDRKLDEQAKLVSAQVRSVAGVAHAQIEHLKDRLESGDARIDTVEANQQSCWAEIEKLRKQMSLVERSEFTQADARADEWERESDPRIVVVGASQMVGRTQVMDQLKAHATSLDIAEDNLRMAGGLDGLARNMLLHFDGDNPSPTLAANRAKKFMEGMRRPGGDYLVYEVRGPTGGSQKLYFNKDESPQAQYLKRIGKKLKVVAQNAFPGREVHFAPGTSTISIDWQPMARVFAPRPKTPQMRWHDRVQETIGIDATRRTELKAEWAEALGTTPNEQFSL